MILDKTLTWSESSAQVQKYRKTFMTCETASETHKLPLLVVGEAQRPHTLASVNKLQVHYTGQRSTWVTKVIFLEWLKAKF